MGSELPKGWRRATLGESCDLLVGFAFRSKDFTEDQGAIRLLRGDNIGHGTLRWSAAKRIVVDPSTDFSPYHLRGNDVVLAMDRPWIEAGLKWAVVGRDELPCLLVQRVARMRCVAGVDQRFLAHVVADPRFSRYVRTVQTGTAVPHISARQIGDYEILLPPIAEQRSIADILSALDEKIRSNRRLAEAAASTALHNGEHAAAHATTRVPLIRLADQVKVRGEAPAPYVGLDSMARGSTVLSDWKTADAPSGASWAFEPFDILFGKLRPYFRKVAVAPIAGRCTREIVVLRPTEPHYFGLVVAAVASQSFIDHCVAVSTGTRMPRAEWKDAGEFEVGVPRNEQLRDLAALARAAYAQIAALVAECRTLTAIRYALLPKLVSGQIRVPLSEDPEEMVGAAVDALDGAGAASSAAK